MKKNRLFYLFLAGVLALPLCFTFAQEEKGKGKGKGKGPGKGGPRGHFQPPKFGDIDADSSGDISKEEWVAFQVKTAKERAERSFGYIAGDDEKISEEELQKMMDRWKGKGRPKGPKGGKGKGGPGGDDSGGEKKPKRPKVEE